MKNLGKRTALAIAGLALFLIPFDKKKESPVESDNDDISPFRKAVIDAAMSQIGQPNLIEYSADALGMSPEMAKAQGVDSLSWCGFYATWSLQQAGANINWVLGKGIAYQLPRTTNPLPGDIAYIDQPYQHHAIVKEVKSDSVVTIDGNSTGGKVAINERPFSEFDAFYSIESLAPNSRIA